MTKPLIRNLSILKQQSPRLGEAFDDLVTPLDNITNQLGSNPNGGNVVPAPVAQVQAQHLGNGVIDIAITDNSSVSRAINYYAEYSQSPSFSNYYTHVMGPSRNSHSLTLPNGTWYLRGRSQYPAGGSASVPISASGPVVVTGSSKVALFPSQGSGTGGGGAGSVIKS